MNPDKRFEKDHWRHKDGSPVSIDRTKTIYMAPVVTHEADFLQLSREGDIRPPREEYMNLVVAKKFATKGEGSAIEAWKRWPHLQRHWPQIRRRICDQCGRRVALSKPRYLVCGGCGAARYCSEACQIANWGHHQTVCAALARQAAREEKARAAARLDTRLSPILERIRGSLRG